jgi:type VI protein secretion system component Hcp
MADSKSTDLLMLLVKLDGSPLETDCQTVFGSTSFQANRVKLDSGRLLQDFKPAEGAAKANFFEIDDVEMGVALKPKDPTAVPKSYGFDAGEVVVNRLIDSASPVLMTAFFSATPFKSAAIVKRRSAGTELSGEAYLRMDFDGVLITKIGWTEGHAVKEEITFIYRGVQVQYRSQGPDGKMTSPVAGKWTMPVS